MFFVNSDNRVLISVMLYLRSQLSGRAARHQHRETEQTDQRRTPARLRDTAYPLILPDTALRRFIDECIVPALVELFVQDQCIRPNQPPQKGEFS